MPQPVNVNYKLANRFMLAHYGVLGMHWGQHLPGRKEASHNPTQPRRVTKMKADPHPDHVETSHLRRQPTSTLSTAQIKKINDRLQTEKKNRELNPKGLSRGKSIALGIIAAAGTGATVYNLANSQAGKAAKTAGQAAAMKILGGALRGTGKHVLTATVKAAARHL